eukprot:scaffold17355_cov90-Skeletonema_dohrnii-CCMP3373.AAC.1
MAADCTSIAPSALSADNPDGTTNSDLELAGGLLQLEAIAQTFDVRERTVLSKGDNLNTTFWERKVLLPPPPLRHSSTIPPLRPSL